MANNKKRDNFDQAVAAKGLGLTGPLNHHQLETLLRTADAAGCSVAFSGGTLTVTPS